MTAGHWLIHHWRVCKCLAVAVCDVRDIARLLHALEQSCGGDVSLAARAVADLCAALRIALVTVEDGR